MGLVQRLLDTAQMRTQYPEWLCKEMEDAAAEIARLTECLKKANDQAEHFEREWYLRGDEIENLRGAVSGANANSPTPTSHNT